jgi:hypothetical protein
MLAEGNRAVAFEPIPFPQIMQNHLDLRVSGRSTHHTGKISFKVTKKRDLLRIGRRMVCGQSSSPTSSSGKSETSIRSKIWRAVSRPAFAEDPIRRSRIVLRNPAPGKLAAKLRQLLPSLDVE